MHPLNPTRVSFKRAAAAALALTALLGGQVTPGAAQSGITFTQAVELPAGSFPTDLVYGPGGSFWLPLSGANAIAQYTPQLAPPDQVQVHPLPGEDAFPLDMTLGPDQALWFTEQNGNAIGRMDQAGQVTEYPLPQAGSAPSQITLGQDGGVWFTEFEGNRIGRITPDGEITEFDLPQANSKPKGITTDRNGNIWFTEWNGGRIGKIEPPDKLSEYAIPNPPFRPAEIELGPDGNLWILYEIGKQITRVDPDDGAMTHFTLATENSALNDLAIGPDGRLWFIGVHTVGRFDVTPAGPANLVETDLAIPVFGGQGRSQIAAGPGAELYYVTANSQTIFEVTQPEAPRRDVQLFVTHLPELVLATGEFTLELEVVNWSDAAATNVVLNLERLDEPISFITATPSIGSCVQTNPLICNLGTLTGGAKATIEVGLRSSRIPEDAVDRVLTAEVSSSEEDLLPANNRAFRFLTIQRSLEYFNDFSAGSDSYWSAAGTAPLGGLDVLGTFDNDRVTLTLPDLPPHDRADLCFDLYVLGGWDGSAMVDPLDDGDPPAVIGPDLWAHYVHENRMLVSSFSNDDRYSQSYPDNYRDGLHPAWSGAAGTGAFGVGESTEARYYRCSELVHTGETYQAVFYGLNLDGASEESWALDNVRLKIYYHAVYDWMYIPMVAK